MASLAANAPMILSGIGAAKAMRDKPKKTPAIPMPDVEAIQRAKKRTAGQRSSGRASTILTGTDDGLGG